MSSSFLQKMQTTADKAKQAIDEKRKEQQEEQKKENEAKILELAQKFAPLIKDYIQKNANKGRKEAYMNFDRSVFSGYGMTTLACQKKMCSLLSQIDHDLEGLNYDAWNNGNFTVHFSW